MAVVGAGACGGGSGGDAGVPVTVGFESASTLVDELSAETLIPVVLTAPATDTVTVDYVISGGTATQGVDYTATSGTLTFSPGQTESAVPLTITFDEEEEINETIVFALENATGATLGTSVHSVTINADILPRLNLTMDRSEGPESQGTQIEVTINTDPSVDVTVQYAVTGSASGGDHDLTSGVLTFPAGSAASQIIMLNPVDDPLDEDDETVVFELHDAVNGLLEGTVQRTHVILDNDEPPTVGFSAGSTTAGENTSPAAPNVHLSAPSGRFVVVNYSAANGSANGGDYAVGGSGQLVFQPGEQDHAIPMTFTNDNVDEDTQDFSISLSGIQNANSGTTVHTVNITDDDPTPSVSITTANVTQGEANTTVNLNVSLSNPSERGPSVQFGAVGGTTASGSDFGYGTGSTLSFGTGTSLTIAVNIADDSMDEFDEVIRTALANPNNVTIGDGQHDLTIGDNDPPPTVQWDPGQSNGSGNEGNPPPSTRSVFYRVVLSAVSGKDITVDVNGSGGNGNADYLLTSPISIPAGTPAVDVTLRIVQDTTNEPQGGGDETITMTLANPVNASLGGTTQRSYTIHDDD